MDLILIIPMISLLLAVIIMANENIVQKNNLYKLCFFVSIINFIFFIVTSTYSFMGSLQVIELNEWIDIYFRMDVFGVIFAGLASFLWAMASLYAGVYMKDEKNVRVFFIFFLLTQFVVMGIAMSGNLFTLYMFYELLTLVTFPLIIHNRSKEALRSGKKYIAYSFLGSTFILMGMMIIFSYTGSLTFTAGGILTLSDHMPQSQLTVSIIALFFGFGVKAALVPFHSWMPAAMISPAPVSALLDGLAIVKSGIFGIIRTLFFVIGAHNLIGMSVMNVLMAVVLVSIVFGSFTGLHQKDLKIRLAYSTISQLGYILFGIVFLNPLGLVGAMLHVVNHALIKILLFFCVGAITFMSGKKTIDEISGIGHKMPFTMICFIIGAVSLIGMPPTNGFVSKWYLGQSAMAAGQTMNILILLLSAFLTSGYLLPIIIASFFSNKSNDKMDFDSRHQVRYQLEDELKEVLDDDFEFSGKDIINANIESILGERKHSRINKKMYKTINSKQVVEINDEEEDDNKHIDPPSLMLAPMFILSVIIVVLGLLPNELISYISVGIENLF